MKAIMQFYHIRKKLINDFFKKKKEKLQTKMCFLLIVDGDNYQYLSYFCIQSFGFIYLIVLLNLLFNK